MATLLKKRVAKYTLDITANYTEAVTNGKGAFAVADYTATNSLTIEGHAYKTGDMVSLVRATGVTGPTLPAADTAYYIIVVDANTIKLATSAANAMAGTAATLNSTSQNGTCYLLKQGFGVITTDIVIPEGAVITDAYYHVITNFTGAAVIGTGITTPKISIGTGVGGSKVDLVAAIALSGGTFDAGVRGTLAGSPALGSDATTFTKGTQILYAAQKAASNIIATAAVNPLIEISTASSVVGGKLELYIEYAA